MEKSWSKEGQVSWLPTLWEAQFLCVKICYTSSYKKIFYQLKLFIQGGPEKILLETIDSFVINSNFCEPPCTM